MMQIGAHVGQGDPLSEAKARGADLVQIFLSDPQSWKKPIPRDDADLLRDSDVVIYVHSPYLVNVATTNNKIRIPSRKILQECCDAAATVGARGVVVHGGHVGAGDDMAIGFDNWRKTFERLETTVPLLIENTAGGDRAMARRFDALARLWDVIPETPYEVGFVLDTCHAHAGGEDLVGIVDRVRAITGRIDLVHANGSKDPADSGRDRHENFTAGHIDPDLIVEVVRTAGAPVVCETPGGAEGQKADIDYLRARLS
jgi:deoxyribonuclease IV